MIALGPNDGECSGEGTTVERWVVADADDTKIMQQQMQGGMGGPQAQDMKKVQSPAVRGSQPSKHVHSFCLRFLRVKPSNLSSYNGRVH